MDEEKKISDLEDISIETFKTEKQGEKIKQKNKEQNIHGL